MTHVFSHSRVLIRRAWFGRYCRTLCICSFVKNLHLSILYITSKDSESSSIVSITFFYSNLSNSMRFVQLSVQLYRSSVNDFISFKIYYLTKTVRLRCHQTNTNISIEYCVNRQLRAGIESGPSRSTDTARRARIHFTILGKQKTSVKP